MLEKLIQLKISFGFKLQKYYFKIPSIKYFFIHPFHCSITPVINSYSLIIQILFLFLILISN